MPAARVAGLIHDVPSAVAPIEEPRPSNLSGTRQSQVSRAHIFLGYLSAPKV
jgi:hypothetical protein